MNQNEPSAIWGENGWAASDGWVLVHGTNTATGEYTGPCDVWVSAGTGLPAGAYLDAPPASEQGMAIVRTTEGWAMLADHRGATAYCKQTRAPSAISEIGEVPTNLTLQQPNSPFDAWDEQTGNWVKDDEAEQQYLTTQARQQIAAMLAEATTMVATLQDAVDLGMATKIEEENLIEWKRYRVTLTRVDVTEHPVNLPPKPNTNI